MCRAKYQPTKLQVLLSLAWKPLPWRPYGGSVGQCGTTLYLDRGNYLVSVGQYSLDETHSSDYLLVNQRQICITRTRISIGLGNFFFQKAESVAIVPREEEGMEQGAPMTYNLDRPTQHCCDPP